MKIIFNGCLIKAEFPNESGLANVSSIFKKKGNPRAMNFRPVSVLPSVFKSLKESWQVSPYVDQFLSFLICGYSKGFSTKLACRAFTERWKTRLINGYCGAILMDLYKTFDRRSQSFILLYEFILFYVIFVHSNTVTSF